MTTLLTAIAYILGTISGTFLALYIIFLILHFYHLYRDKPSANRQGGI